MRFIKRSIVLLVFAVLLPGQGEGAELLFGTSTALSGPAQGLGRQFVLGIEAAFNKINTEGGIAGCSLRLKAIDDAYDPLRTIKNMRELTSEPRMLAIIGNVGTPTAVVSLPVINQEKILFTAAFTGAGFLRPSPPRKYLIHFRASYEEEVKAMLGSIFQARAARPEEIAFFTQQDAFGDAIFRAGIKNIREYGFKQDQVILHLRYPRNTVCVKKAVARLLLYHPQPRVIIMGGTYAPCARFIRLARKYGFKGVFMAVSFVGPEALADKVKKAGERTLITQVVPPYSLNLPIIKTYKRDMKLKYKNFTPSFVSLEGYIAGRILIKGLKKVKGEINRETVIQGLESLGRFDLGLGVPLFLSPNEHQASHHVWPTVIRQGKVVPFKWNETAHLYAR